MSIEICDCGKVIDTDIDDQAYELLTNDCEEVKLKTAVCTSCREEIIGLYDLKKKAEEFTSEIFDWVSMLGETRQLQNMYDFQNTIEEKIAEMSEGKRNYDLRKRIEQKKNEAEAKLAYQKENSKFVYSVHEISGDEDFGDCITDGYDRKETLQAAREYFTEKMYDSIADDQYPQYGDHEEDVQLIIEHRASGREKVLDITLHFSTEEPYDMRKEHGYP